MYVWCNIHMLCQSRQRFSQFELHFIHLKYISILIFVEDGNRGSTKLDNECSVEKSYGQRPASYDETEG